jgi:ectoine hydroxylase-related dioxygenase (phytanoyl-CoA dioxygenase family)
MNRNFFWLCPLLFIVLILKLSAENYIMPPDGNRYPIEMIDPVVHQSSDDDGIVNFFFENGYVVVDDVSEKSYRNELVQLIDRVIEKDIPFSRRIGFLDIYHDQTLAQLRQDPRLYLVFAKIFGSEKLWVVFDRVIYQNPADNDDALTPHVDQNPLNHPNFFNVQAMLALRDMNENTGTLAVVPKSPLFFQDYAQWAKPKDGYIENQGGRALQFVGLRLKEGQIVIWDSRTTHSRFRGEALSNRYAALLTYTLAKDNAALTDLRMKYFKEGIGWNNHDAGLRATASPRCEYSLRETEEILTDLGRKLYGLDSWFNE